MEFACGSRKRMAGSLLILLVFLLLLSLSSNVWGRPYGNDDPSKTIFHQLDESSHSIFFSDNGENIKTAVPVKPLTDAGFLGLLICPVLLSLTHFSRIYRGEPFCEKRFTLVSLRVRMDE